MNANPDTIPPADRPDRKALLDVLGGHSPEHAPFWFMRQAGRYLPGSCVRKREIFSILFSIRKTLAK